MTIEDPFLPPDSSEHEGLVNPEKLQAFLSDTSFEDESAIDDLLINRYRMRKLDNADNVGSNFTRIFNLKEGTSEAASGVEPYLEFEMVIRTLDGKNFELGIYKAVGGAHSTYEYTLQPIGN